MKINVNNATREELEIIRKEWEHQHYATASILTEVNRKKYKETNAEFSKSNTGFINCCEKAGVKATIRQASRFRNKKGLAYKNGRV